MKTSIKYLLPVVTLALAFAACDDTNESGFVPAEPVSADNMAVYFDNTNAAEHVVVPGEGNSITITVSRLNAEAAASIPLVVNEAASELNIPTSVNFEAGQSTTSFEITYSNLESNVKYAYDIAVAEGYYHPYKMTQGGYRLSSFIMQASWDPFKTVKYDLPYKGKSQTFEATVERLGSMNRYRIPNFLGTKAYFTFYEGDPASTSGYYVFEPFNGYEDYNDGYGDAFYWFDADTDEYPVITLEDGTEISYMLFIRSYTGYGTQSYISLKNNWGTLAAYEIAYADGSADYWVYMNFNFYDLNAE